MLPCGERKTRSGGAVNQPVFNEEDIKSLFDREEEKKAVTQGKNEPIQVEFKPEEKLFENQEKKKFWDEKERYQTALKLHRDYLAIPKLILRFIGIFVLIFVISYTIINSPALIKKMKYFWNYDYRNKPLPTDSKPTAQISKNESRLVIPKIDVNAPIIWNVPEDQIIDQLQNGVVQYKGTALPGQQGNIFITGHSSYYIWASGGYKDVFALLDRLSAGDKIYIQYEDTTFTYKVIGQKVVSPNDLNVLSPTGENILSLMTCVPVGTNLNRLIVTSEQLAE